MKHTDKYIKLVINSIYPHPKVIKVILNEDRIILKFHKGAVSLSYKDFEVIEYKYNLLITYNNNLKQNT